MWVIVSGRFFSEVVGPFKRESEAINYAKDHFAYYEVRLMQSVNET